MSLHAIQKIEKICNQITKKDEKPKKPYTVGIVLAAGKGSRMQNPEQTKQMMEIDGIPMVVRSLLAFEACPCIDEIMVVGLKEELPLYRDFKKIYGITKLKKAIQGCDCRAQSAEKGFLSLPEQCEYLAFHDAARCLITPKDIEKIVRAGYRYGAAIAAKKATDTVKIANKDKYIESTPERSMVWFAQTPQVFKKSLYEVALAKAEKLDEKITDDAMLAENAGFHVRLVKCDSENFKVTTPDDIALAESILRKRLG
ncbi:MAG: 2-C-methyl-D-erythritol 4-phosphate cytidylyltransferase [Ruminococcaceae bacterium]|nr:2-C-methyl-D-erythritol 4-phosphate cytidylyltransferase [Oscillospiraceae bacterium]